MCQTIVLTVKLSEAFSLVIVIKIESSKANTIFFLGGGGGGIWPNFILDIKNDKKVGN